MKTKRRRRKKSGVMKTHHFLIVAVGLFVLATVYVFLKDFSHAMSLAIEGGIVGVATKVSENL